MLAFFEVMSIVVAAFLTRQHSSTFLEIVDVFHMTLVIFMSLLQLEREASSCDVVDEPKRGPEEATCDTIVVIRATRQHSVVKMMGCVHFRNFQSVFVGLIKKTITNCFYFVKKKKTTIDKNNKNNKTNKTNKKKAIHNPN